MSWHDNSTTHTTTDTSPAEGPPTLLWLPYVGIAFLCLVFLAINFWCYHRKHRMRYQRKAEVFETRERVMERRILLNIIKARHISAYDDVDGETSTCSTTTLTRLHMCVKHSSDNIVDL